MPTIDTYRKQAKQLVRWHRERNYSIGEKFRLLERYRHLTDIEALNMLLPLTLAQEIVAADAGFADWATLKSSSTTVKRAAKPITTTPSLLSVVPILLVRDVRAAATFYAEKLAFNVDFLHGNPPFYGSVSQGQVCLHLRFVREPNFAVLAGREESLIVASIEVRNVKALFQEYEQRGVDLPQRLVRQAWGGIDFHVRDIDGNVISFVEYRQPENPPD